MNASIDSPFESHPGLGLDLDEKVAAKLPMNEIRDGGAYKTDRMLEGTVVKP